MAFTSSNANESRAWSIGPMKMEIQQLSMLTSDTSGTITAKNLRRIDDYILGSTGSASVASATITNGSGAPTVAFTFADASAAVTGYVAATVVSYIILLGK